MNVTKERLIEAEKLLSDQNNDLAREAFLALLNDCTYKQTYFLSKVGSALRKLNESEAFIIKINELGFDLLKVNDFIVQNYTWCLYDTRIKNYEIFDDIEAYKQFVSASNIIVENCIQLPAEEGFKNPYILTIKKCIKILKNKPSVNYHEILKWINRLNPDLLSMNPYKVTDENGKEFSVASDREFYYYIRSKALEKTEKYQECIECCEMGVKIFEGQKLHYRNHIWFVARKFYCKCKLNMNQEEIKNYEEVARSHKFWYMYHKLSNLYFQIGETRTALIYSLKALLSDKFDPEKMINLFYDIGMLLDANGKSDYAKLYYQCTTYYRHKFRWNINEELRFIIRQKNIDFNVDVDRHKLRETTVDLLLSYEKFEKGKISEINFSKQFGFITSDTNQRVHFKLKMFSQKVTENRKVIFKTGLSGQTNARETVVEAYVL